MAGVVIVEGTVFFPLLNDTKIFPLFRVFSVLKKKFFVENKGSELQKDT